MTSESEILKLVENSIITVNHVFKTAPVCLYMESENDTVPVFSFGNISTLIAPPKVGKTTFIALVVTALLSIMKILNFRPAIPNDKRYILWFDTEQGKPECVKIMKLICKILGDENKHPENLIYLSIREYNKDLRKKIIDTAINYYQNLGFVIIDGIRDLVSSINDEREATEIADLLLKWTETKSIHILNVLHQNKGDANARGHIGTELINKSETVIALQKLFEGGIRSTIVEPKYTRHKEFVPFSYTLDGYIPEFTECKFDAASENISIDKLSEAQLIAITKFIFSKDKHLRYEQLVTLTKTALSEIYNVSFGTNKIKDLLKDRLKGSYIYNDENLKIWKPNFPV
ncbi:MAG: AAA family ATPase [Bacteroidales bacterium]|nr:AAA family ATPase [Bacteroidales bacterium]